jgi:hypothetical protein
MRAEVAFRRRVVIGVDVERIVGTGLHAALAADAARVVEVHDAIVAAEQRRGRADFNARSRIAVIAPQHCKMTAGVGKAALFHVLDPGAENAYRDFVLLFTCNRAGMAADTSILIDDKTKILSSHSKLQDDYPIQAHTSGVAITPAGAPGSRYFCAALRLVGVLGVAAAGDCTCL